MYGESEPGIGGPGINKCDIHFKKMIAFRAWILVAIAAVSSISVGEFDGFFGKTWRATRVVCVCVTIVSMIEHV